MKEEKFTKALGEIDEKYVAEVFDEGKTKKVIPFKKWVAIAACICLLLASATVVIAKAFDIEFNKYNEKLDYTFENVYGQEIKLDYIAETYTLDYDIDFHSLDSFGPMEEMKKGIDSQGKRIMHVSELPPEYREQFIETYGEERAEIAVLGEHLYKKSFGNREAALEYVGFNGFEFPDYGLNDEQAEVYLYGFSSNELTVLKFYISDMFINLDEEPNIVFSYSAEVVFDDSLWNGFGPYAGFEGDTFSEERFTSENGIEYLVVRRIGEDGLTKEIRSFLIKNDILYEAFMIDYQYEENLEDYMDFIHNWADFY